MDKEAIMIRDSSGLYWLQTKDADGRSRSSFLGNVGRAETVEAWCLGKGIEFRQVEATPARRCLTVRAGVVKSSKAAVERQAEFAAVVT